MVDSEGNRALLNAYRNSTLRYQKLLKTNLTEVEQDYIKERLSACRAAVKALSGSEIEQLFAPAIGDGAISFNRSDVRKHYFGRCHRFSMKDFELPPAER